MRMNKMDTRFFISTVPKTVKCDAICLGVCVTRWLGSVALFLLLLTQLI